MNNIKIKKEDKYMLEVGEDDDYARLFKYFLTDNEYQKPEFKWFTRKTASNRVEVKIIRDAKYIVYTVKSVDSDFESITADIEYEFYTGRDNIYFHGRMKHTTPEARQIVELLRGRINISVNDYL